MRWSAKRWWATSRSYRGDGSRIAERRRDRLGRDAAGEQRLPDSFAGHHVGGGGGVADEQHRPGGEA